MLPDKLKAQLLKRFDELQQEGKEILATFRVEPGGTRENNVTLRVEHLPDKLIWDHPRHNGWIASARSLVDRVCPAGHIHRDYIRSFADPMTDAKTGLENSIAILRAIKRDFEDGMLDNLAERIESSIASDYMGQAERLVSEGQSGLYDHVPAAVLCGAVLENSLRVLCGRQTPPVPVANPKGEPLTMMRLIEDLKKAGAFKETMASQLRAWTHVRNHAAHGEFDKFTRNEVDGMLAGVRAFLAIHL